MDISRRLPAAALGSLALAATALAGTTAVAAQDAPTYRFTIANLSAGQPLTPPVIAIHSDQTAVVRGGEAASAGVQQVAENGDNAPLVEALEADEAVAGVGQGESPILSGGAPGAADLPTVATIEVSGAEGAAYFSLVAMLICTNDGFAVVAGQALPTEVGQASVFHARAYDAGTETNTEDFANLVPPCQPLVGVSTDDEGVGETDPSLAENGVVSPHPGISGGTDLDPAIHAIAETPALVVVERIS